MAARARDDNIGMEPIGDSLPVQAMVMRDMREQVDQTSAAAQVQAVAPADVILELSAAAQTLLNLR